MRKFHSTVGRDGARDGNLGNSRSAPTPVLGTRRHPTPVPEEAVPVFVEDGAREGSHPIEAHDSATLPPPAAREIAVPASAVRAMPGYSRVGTRIGAYRVIRELGRGGMGAVYLAEHELIGRKSAIKVLLPQYSSHAEIVNRFFNEARAAAMAQHPGLVDIVDFGHDTDGTAYLVMEYLNGESLTSHLERNKTVTEDFALGVARQIAGALAAAHSKSIVHRDLKPDNIFLVPDPDLMLGYRVKILDFGIAKLMTGGTARQTDAHAILGTPAFMAPEQCRGAAGVDHRSDIYSLGCIVYRMVSGRRPFQGTTADLLRGHLQQQPPPPSSFNPLVEPLVEEWILKMMQKDSAARYQSMSEVIQALDDITGGSGRFSSGRQMPAAEAPTPSQESVPTLPPATDDEITNPMPDLPPLESEASPASVPAAARASGAVAAPACVSVAAPAPVSIPVRMFRRLSVRAFASLLCIAALTLIIRLSTHIEPIAAIALAASDAAGVTGAAPLQWSPIVVIPTQTSSSGASE